ncbi:hypothetical protein MMC29_001728 [Sticta canariensis]|nr:hypothetical protein [Sticta canariensis]
MFPGVQRSTVAGESSTKQSSDANFQNEVPMFVFGENSASSPGKSSFEIAAFEQRPISRILAAVKICLILAVGFLDFPQKIDPSDPQAFLWIFAGELWVWPLWLASIIAYSALLLIGGRGYDSFFASRYTFDRVSSAWIRIRTSTNPAGEHLRHTVITGIFVTAACFMAVETVLISCLFFGNLWVMDKAIEEGDQQAQENMSWLAHPGLRFILASVPVYFCWVLIKRSVDLYRIGTEARTDRIEDDIERRRYKELRSRTPLDAYVAESGSFSFTISPRNTSFLPPDTSGISAPVELGDLPQRPTKRVNKLNDTAEKLDKKTGHVRGKQERRMRGMHRP